MCGDLLDIIEANVTTAVFLGLEEDVWNIQLLSQPANSASSELTHSLVLREETYFWRSYTPTLSYSLRGKYT
jgi:hypothetical protein